MNLYEIVNPSDPVTFYADDHLIATAVILLVGEGKYGGNCREDNEFKVPFLAFAGENIAKDFLEGTFGNFSEFLKKKGGRMFAALKTFAVASFADRKLIDNSLEFIEPARHAEYLAKVNDDRRSSLNDICGYAARLAERMEHRESAT